MTLEDHVRRYLELAGRADGLFSSVLKAHGDLMPCKPGCDDCCNVFFELGLIEAFVIGGIFRRSAPASVQRRVHSRVEAVEPLFREAKSMLQAISEASPGTDAEIAEAAAKLRLACPMKEDRTCVIYEYRPITCRLYGAPQDLGDRVVTCPRTRFKLGEPYTVVRVKEINDTLARYSLELLKDLIGCDSAATSRLRYSMPAMVKTSFDKEYFLRLRQGFEDSPNQTAE